MHSGANVLILDEPTNHLDLESREALEAALQGFQGAVLLISHDRALLDAVGSRTIAVEDKALRSYVGGWAEYLRVREERVQDERTAKRAKPQAGAPAPARASSGPVEEPAPPGRAARAARSRRPRPALKALEEELADPAAWSSPDRTAKSTRRHDAAKRRLKDLYEQWEAVASVGTERIVP